MKTTRYLHTTSDSKLIEALKIYATKYLSPKGKIEETLAESKTESDLHITSTEESYVCACAFIDGWLAKKGSGEWSRFFWRQNELKASTEAEIQEAQNAGGQPEPDIAFERFEAMGRKFEGGDK